ncbi:hypothetical protein FHW03_005021 [Ochrobactrum sp. RH2CCR150]|nr:hypothetical protein [Ochrobactrum sp. RH2CCR150]
MSVEEFARRFDASDEARFHRHRGPLRPRRRWA